MAVARNEEGRGIGAQLGIDGTVVVARIATDVGHQYAGSLASPPQFLGIHPSQVTTIAVAAYGPEGTKLIEPLCQFHGTDVASVPYFITLFKVLEIAVVPISVGVT